MFISLTSIQLLIIPQRSHSAQLAPSRSVSSPALSAQSSTVDLTSWDNAFKDFVHPIDATNATISNDCTGELRFNSVLQPHRPESPALAVMPIALGNFISVNLLVFNRGIDYSHRNFSLTFPAMWVIILDARLKLRNIIHTSLGTGKSCDMFTSYATQFLSELEVLSGGIGQPIALIASSKKSSLGGFALSDQDMMPEQLKAHITAILGIQSYNESIPLIDFTRDAENRVSA